MMKNAFRLLVLIGTFASYSVRAQNVPDTFSPVVSFQYQDSLADPDAQTTINSPVVSFQYYDWPGDGNLTFQDSPSVSYYFDGMPAILTQPVSQSARVGDPASFGLQVQGSTPLSYQWYFNNSAIAGATSPTLGFSSAQLSQAGSYNVIVSNRYGAATSNPVFLNVFQSPVVPKPSLPDFTVAGSTPAVVFPPTKGTLKTFNTIRSNVMTVVLTHGWQSSSSAPNWPTSMANALIAKGFGGTINIVAWDWSIGANTISPTTAAGRTPAEGEALAAALINALGPNYNQPIHFIGHSLGTLVNCSAANYLHGDSKNSPATKYNSQNTQMTLFDEAELARPINGIYVLADMLYAPLKLSTVIPRQSAWVDNYVSEVGLLHPDAVNVLLWRRLAVPGISDFVGTNGLHGYASAWYQNSVTSPDSSVMGHYWSFERYTMGDKSRPKEGTYFTQSLVPNSPPATVTELDPLTEEGFDVAPMPVSAFPILEAYQGLYAANQAAYRIVDTTVGVIQYAGNVEADVKELFVPLNGQPVYIGTAGSTPAYYGTAPTPSTFQANWDYQFTLQPGVSSFNNVKAQKSGLHFVAADTASPPFISIPVTIPADAVGMSFEYELENAAATDFMTMAIGAQNYFTMEAAYVDAGAWNPIPIIDVSALAGQQVQIVFALNGTGGPVGTMNIRNIQFFTPPTPTLTLQMYTGQASVTWPISAVNWTLQLSTDLSDPNGWQAVSGAPNDTDYFHSVTFDIGTSTRAFFRLKK